MRKFGIIGNFSVDRNVGGVCGKTHAAAGGIAVKIGNALVGCFCYVVGQALEYGFGRRLVKTVKSKGRFANVVKLAIRLIDSVVNAQIRIGMNFLHNIVSFSKKIIYQLFIINKKSRKVNFSGKKIQFFFICRKNRKTAAAVMARS